MRQNFAAWIMCKEFTQKCPCSSKFKSLARVLVLLLPAQQRFDLFQKSSMGTQLFHAS